MNFNFLKQLGRRIIIQQNKPISLINQIYQLFGKEIQSQKVINFEEFRKTQEIAQKQADYLNTPAELQQKGPSPTTANKEITQERVTKYLSRAGISSRRKAEEMIKLGMVYVNGKKIDQNTLVTNKSKVQIFTKDGKQTPMKETTQVWSFFKPKGFICSHNDPQGRPSIFDYFQQATKIDSQHIIAIGRLDYNSEGLMLLTNDGDLAQMLENPESEIYREYLVRVRGKIDETKFLRIKLGTVISGVNYGPYDLSIVKRGTTNSWIKIGMTSGKNREIRKVMQKYDLQVQRLKRIKYGNYKLGKLIPGDIIPAYLFPWVKRKYYLYMRKKLQNFNKEEKQLQLDQFNEEQESFQIESKDFKVLNSLNNFKSSKKSKMVIRKQLDVKKLIVEND